MANPQPWTGIIPATFLPLKEDYQIDEDELRRLLGFLKSVPGVTGLTCNGRAGDVFSLSREEQRRVIEIHVDEAQGKINVVAGIKAEATWKVIELMQDARDAGANAVLVLPPETFRGVTDLGPDVPCQFFSTIAQAVDIQIIVFQNPRFRGYAYTPETLARLAEIENIVGVKLSNWDIKKYEQDIWALKRAKRRVSILPANDTLLFASYLHGADGSLIGLASLAPHWAVELFEATQRGDIPRAREINDQLFPLVELFYETPGLNIYGAMKEALFMMGILTKPSLSRPPLSPMTAKERDAIRSALEQSGLMEFYRNMRR